MWFNENDFKCKSKSVWIILAFTVVGRAKKDPVETETCAVSPSCGENCKYIELKLCDG